MGNSMSDGIEAAIGSSVGGVVLLCAGLSCLYFFWYRKTAKGYAKVRHTLDDEEKAFQRSLETGNDEFDELFNFSGTDAADETDFKPAELEQLNLLDEYRENLVGGGDVAGNNDSSGNAEPRKVESNPVDCSGSDPTGPRSAAHNTGLDEGIELAGAGAASVASTGAIVDPHSKEKPSLPGPEEEDRLNSDRRNAAEVLHETAGLGGDGAGTGRSEAAEIEISADL